MIRRTSLIHLGFALLALALPGLYAAEKKPNILLILADDMGYGDLSCYGSKQIQTPALDALAAGGIRCTDGYVSNSVCAPSRAGLLTGRSGSRFGFEHNLTSRDYLKPEFAGIPLGEKLISDRLKELGYRTGLIGKWHLGDQAPALQPNARGFDFFFGMLGGGHDYFPTLENNQLSMNRSKVTEIRTPYLTDWFAMEAIDFIRGEGKSKGVRPEQPWFLYLSFNSPHTPMQAKEEDLEACKHIQPERRRIYAAMQRCMDRHIGEITAELRKRGELENTLIVFLSDNGGSVEASYAINAPLRGGKGTFMEGGIRVPTIYHWPAKLKPGVYTRPVSSLDCMATFVTAAGGTPPPAGPQKKRTALGQKFAPISDSVDLLPYFTGEKSGDPHEFLFWRTATRGEAVRMGDWKLLRPNSADAQLYDLKTDVGESKNIIAEHPEIVARMMDAKIAWEISHERPPMFMSDAYYSERNRLLYEKNYKQTQPEISDTENVWLLPN